jgi:hypothetical protein
MPKLSDPSSAGGRPSKGHRPPPLRIGYAERDAAVAALDVHLAAGRIDVEEYGERYARATMSRTRPELEALFVDLPQPRPVFDPVAAGAPSSARVRGQFEPGSANGGYADAGQPRGRRHLPALPIAALVRLVPLIVLVLLVVTHSWAFVLLIPAVWMVAGRGRRCGRSRRDRQRHWRHHHDHHWGTSDPWAVGQPR